MRANRPAEPGASAFEQILLKPSSMFGPATALTVFVIGLWIQPHDPAVVQDASAFDVAMLAIASGTLAMARTSPVCGWLVSLSAGILAAISDSAFSVASAPAILALFAIAVLRNVRVTTATTAATITTYGLCAIPMRGSWLGTASTTAAWCAMVAAVGIAVRAQRSALQAAHDRAVQAEATREEEAQRRVIDERLRIARELHDVIAHHASVINVQSGVAIHLIRTHPEQASAALATVRAASRTVVGEMGQLVGLLRSNESGPEVEPTPGLDQLDELVSSTRDAGLNLSLEIIGERSRETPAVDLVTYRVVQEAITNALKHGTGAAELRIEFGSRRIAVDVRNPIGSRYDVAHAGTGHGLLGMRERLIAVDGTLSFGPDAHDHFLLSATIPRVSE